MARILRLTDGVILQMPLFRGLKWTCCGFEFDYRGHGYLCSDVELECMEEVGYYSSSIGPYLMHSSDKVY